MLMKWLHKLASMHYPLRPPGAVSEDRFIQLCIRCRKCVEVCPFKSIKISHGFPGIDEGTPYIVPREIPCYLCMKCPPVCPTGALKNNIKKEEVKMGIAAINQSTCMAYNGIICRACFERCPMYREAIILKD
ncbi:MAG: 4Fe-4S dicluster domain-containing protein, partial [Methanobacteriota archaeon]